MAALRRVACKYCDHTAHTIVHERRRRSWSVSSTWNVTCRVRPQARPSLATPGSASERPAGYGMANYGRIFRSRREGDEAPKWPWTPLWTGSAPWGLSGQLLGISNDEIAVLLRTYPDRFLGLARLSCLQGMRVELEHRVRQEGFRPRRVSPGGLSVGQRPTLLSAVCQGGRARHPGAHLFVDELCHGPAV